MSKPPLPEYRRPTLAEYNPIAAAQLEYPDSDGKPMADNTKQFQCIVMLQGGLDSLFQDRPDVFVAGDLLWYPVQGNNKLRVAPDAMVVFGRPKGHRGSYKQWREANIAPQVVFEVLSPGNTPSEMAQKLVFYDRHQVEEYYEYDPDNGTLRGWLREVRIHDDGYTNGSSKNGKAHLYAIESMQGWVSPLLGVTFHLQAGELAVTRPDGRRFETYVALDTQLQHEQRRADAANTRADEANARADEANARAERLAARLHALGIED